MRRLSAPLLLIALLVGALVAPLPAQAGAAGSPARSVTAAFESVVIGHTVKGRPIRAWHLGDPASPVKAVFVGTIHGNEAGPARILEDLRDGAPVTYVIGFHQPLHGVDDSYVKTHSFATLLSQNLGLPLKVFHCNHRCHGTMTQWFNKRLPGMALTVEYGDRMTWTQKHVTGPAGLLASIGAAR
ncbi:MAG: hypothetical protein JF565_07345 [Propionibacteriales bacterium]|nr:hypothetical protein [Propionibacteriales bacterium]